MTTVLPARCEICDVPAEQFLASRCQRSVCWMRDKQQILPTPDPSRDVLNEREKTHGSFKTNAVISQQIKHVFHSYGQYPTENPIYCESLDMIALKLSRILSGQANFKDHWDDIAGYAKLASEACK